MGKKKQKQKKESTKKVPDLVQSLGFYLFRFMNGVVGLNREDCYNKRYRNEEGFVWRDPIIVENLTRLISGEITATGKRELYFRDHLLSQLKAKDDPLGAADDYVQMVFGHVFTWQSNGGVLPRIVRFQDSLRAHCCDSAKGREASLYPASLFDVMKRAGVPSSSSGLEEVWYRYFNLDTDEGDELKENIIEALNSAQRFYGDLMRLNLYPPLYCERINHSQTRALLRLVAAAQQQAEADPQNRPWKEFLGVAWLAQQLNKAQPLNKIGSDKIGNIEELLSHPLIQELPDKWEAPQWVAFNDELVYNEANYRYEALHVLEKEEEENEHYGQLRERTRPYYRKVFQRWFSEASDLNPSQQLRLASVINRRNLPLANDEDETAVFDELNALAWQRRRDIFATSFNLYIEALEEPVLQRACRQLADWALGATREEFSDEKKQAIGEALYEMLGKDEYIFFRLLLQDCIDCLPDDEPPPRFSFF